MTGTNEASESLEMLRLRVQNAVLRIAARHHNLLQRHVFEELSEVVGRFTSVRVMALIVRDGPDHVRFYAVGKERPDFAMMGARIPQTAQNIQTVHVEGRPFVCADAEAGSEPDRLLAQAGFRSYVELPVRGDEDGPVIAGLVFAFREKSAVKEAPMAILQDVAEVIGANMKRAMDAARDRRLAMILETSGDAMISWDKDDRITDANGAAAVLAARPREELLGMSIRDLLSSVAEDSEHRPGPQGTRMHLLTPAGPRMVSATITSVDDDPMVAAHALLRDQSEVVKSEEKAALHLAHIRRLEEQHRTVLDNTPLIIFRLDPATKELVYLNRHAERLLGVPMREAMSTPGFLSKAHADEDSVADFELAVEQARSGQNGTPYEARLKRRQGEEITAQGNVYPMLSEKGEVIAIEGVLADVSSEQAARSRLVQADRLSTLGTLAAGVAHEINNPAAFVLLGIDMLDRLLRGSGVEMAEGPRSQAGNLVKELRDSVRRIVDIARDLRLFASTPGDSGRRTFVDVNRSVESALTLTRGHIIERAQIVRDLGDVPPVLMDDSRLGQVIVNLLVNAAQAIPKPGSVPSTRSGAATDGAGLPQGGHTISVTTRLQGDDVVIEVSDTGVGIAPENLNRIWMPFFTTKSPEVGTGLGLSISKDIVDRAGGTIAAESPVPGTRRGTRFTISIPVAKGPMPVVVKRTSTPPSGVRAEGRSRVLLVEDEPALARALAEGIGRLHTVRVAASGQEALDLLVPAALRERPSGGDVRKTLVSGQAAPRNEGRFDVVLCDLRMPGMSGEALYNEVKSHDEAQARAFIFMTGVGFGADVERFLRDAGRPVLEKPFATQAALDLIAKVVSKRKAAV
jgi:PAS domain S-box-containing protein